MDIQTLTEFFAPENMDKQVSDISFFMNLSLAFNSLQDTSLQSLKDIIAGFTALHTQGVAVPELVDVVVMGGIELGYKLAKFEEAKTAQALSDALQRIGVGAEGATTRLTK